MMQYLLSKVLTDVCCVRACSMGKIDTRPEYHTSTCLWPVGLTTQLWDVSGVTLQSRIADGGKDGPVFLVSLVLHPGNASSPLEQVTGAAINCLSTVCIAG